MRYNTSLQESRLLLAESELERIGGAKVKGENMRGRQNYIRYDSLEGIGEEFVRGCEGIVGCGCLSMIIGVGVLGSGLYLILR